MYKVEEDRELLLKNVLSFRDNMTQLQIEQEVVKLNQEIERLNIETLGNVITATFGIKEINGQHLADTEILVPIKNKIDNNTTKYKLIDEVNLKNLVYMRYSGHINDVKDAYLYLMNYIKKVKKSYKIISVYNVHISNISQQNNVIDFYVNLEDCK